MLRQLLVIGVAVFTFIPTYGTFPVIPERTDAFGIEWVGPIRKCPNGVEDRVLDECAAQITRDLTPKVGAGIEELGLEPLDPLFVSKYLYEQDLGPIKINILATNTKMYNLPKYKYLKFKVDTTKRIMKFIYEAPSVKIDSDYKLGGNVFFFPLKGSGPVKVEVFGLKVEGQMNFYKTTNENGETVIQLKDTVIKTMSIKDMKLRIQGLFDGNPLFTALVHYFGNRYGPEIFEIARSDISKHSGEVITNTLLNPVLNRLPHLAEYVPDI